MISLAFLAVILLVIAAYFLTRAKAFAAVKGDNPSALHSRPGYHGAYAALWTGLTGFGLLLIGSLLGGVLVRNAMFDALPADLGALTNIRQQRIVDDAITMAQGGIPSSTDAPRDALAAKYSGWEQLRQWIVAALAVIGALAACYLSYTKSSLTFRARNRTERMLRNLLLICAAIAIMTTIGIVLSLFGETLGFFSKVPVTSFLFGTNWSPLSGVFEGNLDPDNVGAIPLFAGTLLITLIAMLVAVPVGLYAAIYLSDYASARTRAIAKPMLEILAGIPTVVYGFFAAITVAPFIRGTGELVGLSVASESALAAGVVMGIMIIPFISSLSDDVINAVPQTLRDGSYGLGATKAETMRNVVLPAALPGIVSAVLLGASRAIGETMIVVMAAGQSARLPEGMNPFAWPLEALTTVTVQIVTLITGDTEASTAAGPAFSLGFTLFCVTLIFNMIALRLVNKYRERYD